MKKIIKLWEEFIDSKHQPTNDELRYIVKYVKRLRRKAAAKILEQNPTNDDLLFVIKHVRSLRSAALKLLNKKRKDSIDDVKLI